MERFWLTRIQSSPRPPEGLKIPHAIWYDVSVIEIASARCTTQTAAKGRELAPNVRLRQTETEGQFVEIVMPPFELNDLLEECERAFPMYAMQVFEVLAKSHPESMTPPMRLSLEMSQGLRNTQILGMVLTRQEVRGERALDRMSELQQAFGLAMKGRLRLTADPVPDL